MFIGVRLISSLWKEDAISSLVLDLQCHTLSFDYIEVVAESIPRDTMEQRSSHPRAAVGIRLPVCSFFLFFFFLSFLFTGKLGQGQGKCGIAISSAEATPEWKVWCWNKIKLECYLELKTANVTVEMRLLHSVVWKGTKAQPEQLISVRLTLLVGLVPAALCAAQSRVCLPSPALPQLNCTHTLIEYCLLSPWFWSETGPLRF